MGPGGGVESRPPCKGPKISAGAIKIGQQIDTRRSNSWLLKLDEVCHSKCSHSKCSHSKHTCASMGAGMCRQVLPLSHSRRAARLWSVEPWLV